jgi:hypothetical protein
MGKNYAKLFFSNSAYGKIEPQMTLIKLIFSDFF